MVFRHGEGGRRGPGDTGITRQVTFVSSLPVEHHHQLEALLFFNGRQDRVRHGIVTAIDRYGPPEIFNDGNSLRVRVAGPSETQCLFAVEREGRVSRPVGLSLYVRDSFERITVLHLVVAEAYQAGGPHAKYNLLLRLVQAVKRVARCTSGIRRVELLYSQRQKPRPHRPRAAFA
jgi:hypothetical protein